MIYRIYTEDKNRDTIRTIAGTYFDGYSLIPCEGVWKGKGEKALIIEIVVQAPSARKRVTQMATAIKSRNKQEAVMIVAINEDDQCFI